MRTNWLLILAGILFTWIPAPAQTSFTPLTAWTTAVAKGDQAALAKLYSSNPQVVTMAGKDSVALKDELSYWAGIKQGMTDFQKAAPAQNLPKPTATRQCCCTHLNHY